MTIIFWEHSSLFRYQNNNDDSTLSNRLVAMSETQVIETFSSLSDDFPWEINSVGHQHCGEYHHHNIYYDIHCDALCHYSIHNITAFHGFFSSNGGNLSTVNSTVFLQGDGKRRRRNIILPFYTFLLGRVWCQLSAGGVERSENCTAVYSPQDWFLKRSSMQSSWFMQFIDKTFIFRK